MIEDDSGSYRKNGEDARNVHRKCEDLKNKQTEMNNMPEGITSGITEAEEWISDMEDRRVEVWKTM